LQWEKIPSRDEAGDGDEQQRKAARNEMRRVVEEMGDCGCCEGGGAGWLAANENARTPASQLLVSARSLVTSQSAEDQPRCSNQASKPALKRRRR
jgi:hypothetical protein